MEDIAGHFRDKLGVELALFDDSANRTNLEFAVVPTTPPEKLAHIRYFKRANLYP